MTNPTSGRYQVFLRDLSSSNTVLVSATSANTGGNDHSTLPSLSSNGLWIAFESEASDLVADDTNGLSDIFVRDVAGGQTCLVGGSNGASRNPMISADGRYVAFESRASDLIAEDLNSGHDVFLRDLTSGTTALVSVNTNGGSANRSSELLTITPDARFVAFWSDATDISSEVTSTTGEVYVRDIQAGVTYCLTKGITHLTGPRRFKIVLTSDGRYAALQKIELSDPWPMPAPASVGRVYRAEVLSGSVSNPNFGYGRPGRGLTINDDGSRLVFYEAPGPIKNGLYLRDMSVSTNRLLVEVASDVGSFQMSSDFQNLFFTMALTNYGRQLFQHSLLTGETVLLSTNGLGQPIRSEVISPFSIDAAGAILAFETAADDFGAKDFNRAPDVMVSSLGSISRRHSELPEQTGIGTAGLHRGSLSANGKRLSFMSTDNTLVLNDTNRKYDVFLRDFGADQMTSIDGVLQTNSAIGAVISADGRALIFERFYFEERLAHAGDLVRTDLRTGQRHTIGTSWFGSAPWHTWLSQDGRWMAIADRDHIRVTDFRTPALPGQISNQVVDVRFDGTGEGNGRSSNPAISLDGEWVAFLSYATDLTINGGFPLNTPQAFARNLREARTRLLSINDAGNPLAGGATRLMLSANARFVAYQTHVGTNIYRHDLSSSGPAANELVCTNCSRPSISGDGQLVAYQSQGQIHVKDMRNGFVENLGGDQANNATISIDGRYVVFVSKQAGVFQIHLRDRWNSITQLVSRNYLENRGGNGPSFLPVISHDGRTIAFQSFASDLVPGDYNGRRDVFAVQILPVDTDGDGMDDDWEQFYFQSLARDGSGNMDGDHQSDREEFMAGTDPLDAASSLRFTGIASRTLPGPMQDTEVAWASAPGKIYRVQYKADLGVPWTDLPGDVMPGGPKASKLHLDETGPAARGFYRVRSLE